MKRVFVYLLSAIFMVVSCYSFVSAQEGATQKGHCSDKKLYCKTDKGRGKPVGHVYMGQCWHYFLPGCDDCKGTDHAKYAIECNETYPSECKDSCWACDPTYSAGSGLCQCYDKEGHSIVAGTENEGNRVAFYGF